MSCACKGAGGPGGAGLALVLKLIICFFITQNFPENVMDIVPLCRKEKMNK